MFIEEQIKKVQDIANQAPCVQCGGHHRVELGVVYRDGAPLITYDYPEGACEVFKMTVAEYIKKHAEEVGIPVLVL